MRFYPLEKLINLHDGYARQFKIDHLQFLLLQREGQLFLLEAFCPHRAHPLESAALDQGVIQCPRHGYRFALDGGHLLHYTEEPCRDLRTWPVTYEGNEVGVMLGDEIEDED